MLAGVMSDAFGTFMSAAQAGASEVSERPGDRMRSFLEATLEGAIVRHLPGTATIDQGRRRFALEGYDPPPYGVDIEWRHDGIRIAAEVKVSDVLDSLFDVVKLATAIARGHFDEGYCAVAADAGYWARGGAFTEMCDGPVGKWQRWSVEQLVTAPAAGKAVLVATGPRPHTVPAHVETMTGAPIALPKAPTHTLRLLAVRPAAGPEWLDLPRRPE